MRIGKNPNKDAKIEPPARVVVLVITHLPSLQDTYHVDRVSVINHSLRTLISNGAMKYSLIVWDNGSCLDFQMWLRGVISPSDTLILSPNIGKTNALKSVMRMLPPDTILAYGDDDMEYMPNWLAPQIEILETFPNVGTVTGYPVRIASRWAEERTKGWASSTVGVQVERGRFIPDEWERGYCASVGRDYAAYVESTKALQDTRITYKGVQAYATSQHCQFVCYPQRVEPLIPWTDAAMPDEIPFDKAVDAAGLLRLSTVERYTRHIGNVLETA